MSPAPSPCWSRPRRWRKTSGSHEAIGYALAVHGRRFGEAESDEAESYLRRALEIFDEIGAAGRYGWTLSNLASVYWQRGEIPLAEKTFREAVRRLRGTHEQGYLAEAERGLAEVLVEQGKVDEADRLITEAERRVGRGDVWTRASLLHARGLVLAAQDRTDDAEASFCRGARDHRADDVRDLDPRGPQVAGRAARKQGSRGSRRARLTFART